MRVLLDTDVILDFILERDPYVEAAAELLHFNARERYQGFVSSITPINVFYIGRKSVGAAKARTANGLDAIITRNVKDYQNAILPVFTPAEFLQHLKSQQKNQTQL